MCEKQETGRVFTLRFTKAPPHFTSHYTSVYTGTQFTYPLSTVHKFSTVQYWVLYLPHLDLGPGSPGGSCTSGWSGTAGEKIVRPPTDKQSDPSLTLLLQQVCPTGLEKTKKWLETQLFPPKLASKMCKFLQQSNNALGHKFGFLLPGIQLVLVFVLFYKLLTDPV